jgi:hypothetical protein
VLGAHMRLSAPLAAAALALLMAPGCAPVRAEPPYEPPDEGYAAEPYDPEEAPDPEEYREDLGSYGEWYDDPRYGPVWHPYASGWQPYADGYWAWTSYGWTWVSYEPWAWTLHYGRWAVLPVGWVWVPGTVWGPAYVDWYWGNGYVGWAPLSPFGHVTVINNFVFVNEHDFCSRDVGHHFVHHRHISDRDWRARDHRRPPRHDRIERVSRHTVTRLDGRPRNTLAPHRPDTRPDLTGARRGRGGEDQRRRDVVDSTPRPAKGRGRPDREPRVREPGFRFDDDGAQQEDTRDRRDVERTASRPAWGRARDVRPDRQPRVREPGFPSDGDEDAPVYRRERPERGPRVQGPRFDAEDRPQFQRGHAWAARGGSDPRGFAGGAPPRMQGSGGGGGGGRGGDGGGRPAEGGHRGDGRGQGRSGPGVGFATGGR